MDFGVFETLAGSCAQAQGDIIVQVAEVATPNSFMLWDGYKKIVGVINVTEMCDLDDLTFATIELKQYKVFGRERLIISQFEVVTSGKENGKTLLTQHPALQQTGLANLRTGKNKTVCGVVLSVDRTYSNPDDPLGNKRFRKIMLADHTGSVNVTAWRECVELLDGISVGDFIKITNVNLESNEKYQQAATCKIGVTLSGTSTIVPETGVLEIPQKRLRSIKSVVGADRISVQFDLFGVVEDVERYNSVSKTRVVRLLDPTVDPQSCPITLSGNLAGRFSLEYKYKLVMLCNLQVTADGTVLGRDTESFCYICMQRTKQTIPVVEWAIKNGYITSAEVSEPTSALASPQPGSSSVKRPPTDDERDSDIKRKPSF